MNRARASAVQLSHLAEHMKYHPEMSKRYIGNTLQDRAYLEKQWLKLINKLNSMEGPIKTLSQWKQTWRDLKNSDKRKMSHNIKEQVSEHSGGTDNDPGPLCSKTATKDQVAKVQDPTATDESEDGHVTESEIKLHLASDPILPGLCVAGPSRTTGLMLPDTNDASKKRPLPNTISAPKKRRRVIFGLDSFDKKILQIEEEKIKIKKEKNILLQNKNAAINRLGDILQELCNKLLK